MQKEILEKHPAAKLRVYVVWFSMIPTDARSRWRWMGGVLEDSRVLHFWDEKKKVGRLFADKDPDTDDADVVWDAFYLYGPDAEWPASTASALAPMSVPPALAGGLKPGPLISSGATVRSEADELKNELEPLLR